MGSSESILNWGQAAFLLSGSRETLGRHFQHFPFATAAVVGFGKNFEHGVAVRALEIVGQEIVPAMQAAVALRVDVDDVAAAGEGFDIIGVDVFRLSIGERDVGQRAICQAVGGAQQHLRQHIGGLDADGGAQVGAVIAHGSGLSVGDGVQAAFQFSDGFFYFIPPSPETSD